MKNKMFPFLKIQKERKSHRNPKVCPQIPNDLKKLHLTHAFEKQHADLYTRK